MTTSIDTVLVCLDEMMNLTNGELHQILSPDNYSVYSELFDMIDNAQGYAEAAKKEYLDKEGQTAVWIHCCGRSSLWHCSCCGEKIIYNPERKTYKPDKKPVHEINKFCRHCGAKMNGKKEETYATHMDS